MLSFRNKGLLLMVSGPAGSGKTTLCDQLIKDYPYVERVVTTTTRPPRKGEVQGEDYHFLSPEAFEEQKSAGEFYETALIHGNAYGTFRREIDQRLQRGASILLNIDVQGVANYQVAARQFPILREAMVTVFIYPPSLEVLRERLEARGSEEPKTMERRLQTARQEIQYWNQYDYILTTGERSEDYRRFQAIFLAENLRRSRLIPES